MLESATPQVSVSVHWFKLFILMLYIVKYSGPFGFIKPWTAVRDSETFSQQFLTPSIVEGMEKKCCFPNYFWIGENSKNQKASSELCRVEQSTRAYLVERISY